MWLQNTVRGAELLRNNFTGSLRRHPDPRNPGDGSHMYMQLLPGMAAWDRRLHDCILV